MTRSKLAVAGMLVFFTFYAVTIGWRGVLLIEDGRTAAVALGVGVVLLPLLTAYGVWREVQFGMGSERLARRLASGGALVVDDLPRRPSGRIDRAAADVAFERYRAEAESNPEDWAVWYRLGTAYDASGDRRRARAAVRHALELERAASRSTTP